MNTKNEEEFMSELKEEFLQKCKEDIIKALEENDFSLYKEVGHDIKGAGGVFNLDYLSELGYKLELAGENKDIEKIRIAIDQIKYQLKINGIEF